MKTISYWLDTPYSPRPALKNNITVDVVVIGGGITGVSTAYHCVSHGLDTILIEKDTIASGSAGKNGGMVVEGLNIDFIEMVDQCGEEKTLEIWKRTAETRNYVISLIKQYTITCDFSQPGSLYVGQSEKDDAWLAKEGAERKKNDLKCSILEKGFYLKNSTFTNALFNSDDALLDPVKFVRELATLGEKKGLKIFENTEALSYSATSVVTPGGTISAKRIVVAIESNKKDLPQNSGKIECEQIAVTEEFSEEELSKLGWDKGGMLWPIGTSYLVIRKLGKRLLLNTGMYIDCLLDDVYTNEQKMLDLLIQYFPELDREAISFSHHWTGYLLHPTRFFPHITTVNGYVEIFGQGGNGLTNGIMTGKMVADSFIGKTIPDIYIRG